MNMMKTKNLNLYCISMNLIVYKGFKEIDGSRIELIPGSSRILMDLHFSILLADIYDVD